MENEQAALGNAGSPADASLTPLSVEDAIRTRHSVRAYLSRPIARADIERILQTASHAPSGSNFQPWRVYVLTGSSLARVGNAVRSAYLSGEAGHVRDYTYYPADHYEPFQSRRRECGWGLYTTLNIQRHEKEKMKQQRATNYVFFGAPCGLIFTIDAGLETGSFLDYGFFLQSIMIAAKALGIDSCPQASIGEYPDIVRRELQLPRQERILCGIALGYADTTDIVNSFSPPRAPVADFATFLS